MTANVSFTELPSTEGATQTRTTTVRFTTPDYDSLTGRLVLKVDATQNGSFRDLDENLGLYDGSETETVTFTTFIGVPDPYDLRIVAEFEGTGEDRDQTTTVQATESVGGQRQDPTVPTLGAEGDLSTDTSIPTVRGDDATNVTPRIGPVEPITMSASYQLPWERDTNQTACGETLQNQNGDLDWRIVFEGLLTLGQVDKLRSIRDSSGSVETRSVVFGVREVAFDNLQLDHSEEPEVIEVNGSVEPVFEFQLQTKGLGSESGAFGG